MQHQALIREFESNIHIMSNLSLNFENTAIIIDQYLKYIADWNKNHNTMIDCLNHLLVRYEHHIMNLCNKYASKWHETHLSDSCKKHITDWINYNENHLYFFYSS